MTTFCHSRCCPTSKDLENKSYHVPGFKMSPNICCIISEVSFNKVLTKVFIRQPLANKQKKLKKIYQNICPWDYPRDLQKKKLTSRARRTFSYFSDFWIRIVKIMCPRVGQGLDINLQKQTPIVNKQYPCLVKFSRTICNS